jgi:hypothetical protein
MSDGIGPWKGYDLVVNGFNRSFRDRREFAIEAAIYMKSKWPNDLIQIRDCGTGDITTVLPDGRLG